MFVIHVTTEPAPRLVHTWTKFTLVLHILDVLLHVVLEVRALGRCERAFSALLALVLRLSFLDQTLDLLGKSKFVTHQFVGNFLSKIGQILRLQDLLK